MNWLKNLITIVLGLIVIGIGILFTIHNTDQVAIDLVFFQLPEASVSLWLIAAFVLGALCGILLSTLVILSLKTRLRSSQRKVMTFRKELDKLRTAGLKDSS
ncbi:MAG: LapA family protein [Pseudomonadota bacterium]|nr:LapA family protein [Pseudomonadota bacterium]